MNHQTPTTALELLEALPTGTRVQDKMGDVGTIHPGGMIVYPNTAPITLEDAARKYTPFSVLAGSTHQVDYATVGGYGPESLPGHAGSETSEDAARHPGIGPKTERAHAVIQSTGTRGVTEKELGAIADWSHGAASGALSRLHRAGVITRTTEKRARQLVYVDPQYLNGREESPYRPNAAYRQDRRPMPLERPEPTLASITEDLQKPRATAGVPVAFSERQAAHLAPTVLEIVRSYR